MRRAGPVGILDRAAVGVLHGLGRRLWGFPPRLMPALVARRGALRTLGWFVANMPRYERTRSVLGPLRTHLLATTVSLANGCNYCAFGHAYALDLIYLRDHGRLFPSSVEEILQLRGAAPESIREALAEALKEAGLPEEDAWVARLLAVSSATGPPATRDDARLAHLVAMFGVLNECGSACDVAPDEAHDPVNKDTPLKRDLAQRRSRP